MIDLQKLPAAEAERLAYAEGFVGTAELFGRIAELEAEKLKLENQLEDARSDSLIDWERRNGPAYEYVQFFQECFTRLAGAYPCPSITSDYDKNVIFETLDHAIEAGYSPSEGKP